MADTFNFVQVQDLSLAGAGITATATTIVLKSFTYVDDTTVVMADFGDIGYMTLEPNTEREENISFTGITQNANGTATLTGVTRGLLNKAPYTADSTLRKAHGGSTLAVVSNSAAFYNQQFTKDIITFGDGTNTDKELIWDAGEVSDLNPEIKYDATANQLKFRRYGETSFTEIPLSLRGTYANYAALPTDGSDGDIAITTDDYKLYVYNLTGTTWVLAGGSSGAGTMYVTEKLGSEATGADNRTFDLTAGSWPDSKFLMVYQNGQLMREGATEDYQVSDSDTIVFNYDVEDASLVTMIVVSVDLYNPAWGSVTEDVIPDTTNTHTLGDATHTWSELHLEDAAALKVAAEAKTASTIPIRDSNGDVLVATTPTAGDAATSKTYVDAIKFVDKVLVDTTETTLTNSTTETTVATVSIPAGSLGTNNAIRGKIAITDLDKNNTHSFTISVKYGGTTILTTTVGSSGSDLVSLRGYYEFNIYADGATDAQYADSKLYAFLDRTEDTTATSTVQFDTGSAAEDSTGALTLEVTVDWSDASVSNSVTVKGAVFELIQ